MNARFPTKYYAFHDDPNLNFQLNRCLTWAGEEAAQELSDAASRIDDYASWKRELLALAARAEGDGRLKSAAYFYRAAEFFMTPGDEDKDRAYAKFIGLIDACYPDYAAARVLVPYSGSFLPAWRIAAPHPKGVVAFHGGFDSFIEELYPVFQEFARAGFDLVAFEGPGQGAALSRYGLAMSADWHRPVAAVLDFFGLDDVTLVGMSLGGCLALRAAAFEPRVKRVIAFDALYDFYDCVTFKLGRKRALVETLLSLGLTSLVDAMIAAASRRSLITDWGIKQGTRVTGSRTPSQYLRRLRTYTTRDISARVGQDVLLMGGSEDHFIPARQFHDQSRSLTSARSLTARLFTSAESAQNHCQIGNVGLALETMLAWIAERTALA